MSRRADVRGSGWHLGALWLTLFALVVLAMGAGTYRIDAGELLRVLWSRLGGPPHALAEALDTVVWQVRLPRVAAALLAGAALAMSGAGMQAVFRNPLASPDLLGVSSGAAFGAVLGIFLRWPMPLIQTAAFCGGLGAALLVALSARWLRSSDRILNMILCGIAIGSVLSACVAMLKYLADPGGQLPAITFWLLGSFSGVAEADAIALALTTSLAAGVLFLLGWRVDLLLLSDDEVHTSGVHAARLRALVVVACTLAASGAVAICGIIGWIGLVVPHAVRLMLGGGFARSLTPTILCGAILMLVVDTFSRSLTAADLPPGILMALIGGPALFGLLALRPAR